jgi:hypothetical protein
MTDYRLIQKTDPTSRQRGRYKITNNNFLKENLKEKEKLVVGPRWAPDTKTGRLIVGRNVNLTLTLVLRTIDNLQGAHKSQNCTRLSMFHTFANLLYRSKKNSWIESASELHRLSYCRRS